MVVGEWVYYDVGDLVLYGVVLPILTTVGIIFTSIGITQLVGVDKSLVFFRMLPVFRVTVLSFSLSVPLALVIGLALFALVAFLIVKTREIVITL